MAKKSVTEKQIRGIVSGARTPEDAGQIFDYLRENGYDVDNPVPEKVEPAESLSEFALRGFTLSLSEEYKRIGNPKFCLITLGSTLTSFGPMNFGDKKEEMEKGKAYFTPNWVTQKLTEIIKDDKREIEYTLYPGEYGLGEWKKPEPI